MLINVSNHPSQYWPENQMELAISQFSTLIDLPFSAIDPRSTEGVIDLLASDYFTKIMAILDECANEPYAHAIHIQGEYTFVFRLVTLLKASGIRCIASTSNRNVEYQESGDKIVKFDFIGFRDY